MDIRNVKYIKLYMGVTSGTLGGRDDGYPEVKRVFYTNFRDLVRDYGKHKEEVYFSVSPVQIDPITLAREVTEEREKMAREKKEAEEARDRAELERLKKKLGEA